MDVRGFGNQLFKCERNMINVIIGHCCFNCLLFFFFFFFWILLCFCIILLYFIVMWKNEKTLNWIELNWIELKIVFLFLSTKLVQVDIFEFSIKAYFIYAKNQFIKGGICLLLLTSSLTSRTLSIICLLNLLSLFYRLHHHCRNQ